MMCA